MASGYKFKLPAKIFESPGGILVLPSGNILISDSAKHVVYLYNVTTTLATIFAGKYSTPGYADGFVGMGLLNGPRGLALDVSGNVYIADSGNNRIRKVATNGALTTFAGNGLGTTVGDNGLASAAGIPFPTDVAINSSGEMFVVQYSPGRVRKIATDNIITTTNFTAGINYFGIAINSSNDLFASAWDHVIYKLASPYSGSPTVYTGTSGAPGAVDGSLSSALLNYPCHMKFDASGDLYVAEAGNHKIRKITTGSSIITSYAGNGTAGYSGDNGSRTSASLRNPYGVAVNADASLVYIVDSDNAVLRAVNTSSNKINTTFIDSGTTVDMEDMFVSKDIFLNNQISAFGTNEFGRLGLNDIDNRSSPIQVGSLTNWRLVTAGTYQSIAIKTDGTLWSWGRNNYGQLGLNDITDRSSPVQVGSLTNWKQVSGGWAYTATIKTDGTLWLWGRNNYGQLGVNDVTNRSSPVQVGLLTNWKQVSCGNDHAIAIKTDGTLWSWGRNHNGQLGLGHTNHISSPVQVGSLTNWKFVAGGYDFNLAIKTDGTLWSWGSGTTGQLGTDDATSYSSPVQVGSLTDWKQVSCGWYHALAVKSNGTLWGWGLNAYGTLGVNNQNAYISPVQVGALTNWKNVDCGNWHSTAIKTDGTLWAWGHNNRGQLGLGDTTSRSSPIQVGSITNWTYVSGGRDYTLVIQSPDLP